jgi:hypothetical protein
MTDLIAIQKIAGWEKLKTLVARQRLLADYETGVQHGAGRVPRLVPAGAPARRMPNEIAICRVHCRVACREIEPTRQASASCRQQLRPVLSEMSGFYDRREPRRLRRAAVLRTNLNDAPARR